MVTNRTVKELNGAGVDSSQESLKSADPSRGKRHLYGPVEDKESV